MFNRNGLEAFSFQGPSGPHKRKEPASVAQGALYQKQLSCEILFNFRIQEFRVHRDWIL